MTRTIPALIAVFMSTLSVIPWAPRELGWYAADVGLRMPALATMPCVPQLARNPRGRLVADKPIDASNLNRAHGYVIALVVALLPYCLEVMFTSKSYTPWELANQVVRAPG